MWFSRGVDSGVNKRLGSFVSGKLGRKDEGGWKGVEVSAERKNVVLED